MTEKRARRQPRGLPSLRGLAGSRVLASILLLSALTAFLLSTPAASGQVSRTISMAELFFEPSTFRADPGDNVTLRLVNNGVLEHTFTLFEEANASVPVDNNAALQDFYARSAILVDLTLGGGQEATVNFTAPQTVGVYTFVCIITNHAVGGMHGLMFVGMVAGNGDLFGGIGIIQGLLIITLLGVVVFAVIYHVRSTQR